MNQKKQEYFFKKIYGGENKKNPPFEEQTKIKQIFRLNDNEEELESGEEKYVFIKMHEKYKDIMLLKPLNFAGLHGTDTRHPQAVKIAMKSGYQPNYGNLYQLHYKYADRFMLVEQ